MARHDPDRLLVRDGFRHFRRTYSMAEVRIGLVILAVLIAITVWIGWRGTLRPAELYGAVELQGTSQPQAAAGDGVLPTPLIDGPWRERERSSFDESNLYEKINGRADFFTSKGFEKLIFVSIANTESPELIIDLELYDMGSPAGALAAFTAERKAGVTVTETPLGQHYTSRNALFLVRGRYYGRALGSDESETTQAALGEVRQSLERSIEGTARSWALELFVDNVGVSAGNVAFVKELAFSLEAAKRMWVATRDDDSEMFISVRTTPAEAEKQAAEISAGFASYGSPSTSDERFVVDEFVGSISAAISDGPFIVGVRAAPSLEVAISSLAVMTEAVSKMSPELRKRAAEAAAASSAAASSSTSEDSTDATEEKGIGEPGGTEQTTQDLDGEETY